MTTLAIIQARMGSSRLPGKVARALGGRPVVAWVVRAAQAAPGVDHVVVATSTDAADDEVEQLATEAGAAVTRGAVDDVLQRFLLALDQHGGDRVVRLTADCPLLDPALIGAAAGSHAAMGVDYLATISPRSFPRGLDVEVVSSDALRVAGREASGTDRVHVTPFVYDSPGRFTIGGLSVQPRNDDLRVTLDTTEDAELLDALVAELGDRPPRWQEVVALLRSRPDLIAINAGVRQKERSEG